MATLILSVIGSDRPGLTQALAGAVLAAGGNWLESHLSRLGGLYVGSVLVELDEARVDALRAAVREVDAQGLEVRIAPAPAPAAPSPGEDARFSLVGQDRPGIVQQVTAVFTRLGANIEAFETWLGVEPHSGAPLFHMDARLRLPPPLRVDDVQAALEEISGEIMVDIALTPANA
jgi:glycine cleavage system regulatory protein